MEEKTATERAVDTNPLPLFRIPVYINGPNFLQSKRKSCHGGAVDTPPIQIAKKTLEFDMLIRHIFRHLLIVESDLDTNACMYRCGTMRRKI